MGMGKQKLKQQLTKQLKQQLKQPVKPRVRIIGAGIGGLTLGRTLLKHGIPAVLYDRRPSARRLGYAVTLHAPTYRPLLDVLGLDEQTFRSRVAVDARYGGTGRIDPALLVRPTPGVDYATSFRVHRHSLQRLLADAEGLDVRYGKEIELVAPGTEPGLLALHLEDSAAPNLPGLNAWYQTKGIPFVVPPPIELQTPFLVGADGELSVVRKSLSPHTESKILPYVVYSGWRRMTRKQFETICAPAMQASTVIEKKLDGGVVLNVSINEAHTSVVDMGFVYSRPFRGNMWAADALHMANREVDEAKHIPSAFYEEIATLEGLEEPFKYMFDAEMAEKDGRCLHWLMRSALMSEEDLHALAGVGAAFLGDAAHTEPILGGEGINSAITDGLGLGNCIAKHGSSGVPGWYDSRFEAWENGIRKSEDAIREMHSGIYIHRFRSPVR